jgi:rsbT co-antagonist protein RsbR
MNKWFERVVSVSSTDPDIRRRGRVLIILALGITAVTLSFMPVIMTTSQQASSIITILIGAVTFLGAAYLGRIGQVSAGSYLVITVAIVAVLISIVIDTSTPITPFYLVLAILIAGVLLPPTQIWWVLLVCVVGIGIAFSQLPPELRDHPLWAQSLRGAPLILVMAALIVFLSSRSTSVALHEAREARAEAEAAIRGLAESNATLEARVVERTAELTSVLDQQQAITRQLEASLGAQRDMNQVIAELSVPIIPITSDSLVVPLVGAIDSGRAGQLLDDLLTAIESTHARTIILDVTGVAVVDTQVAGALLQAAAAARLMGAETMLVGIRPEVAQTLVGLGVDLDTLHTAASLQDGLAQLRRL